MSNNEPKLLPFENGRSKFIISVDEKIIAEMEIGLTNNLVTVFHTEVKPEAEGKGLAKILLDRLVEYARENSYKVKPLCAFVHARFSRSPEIYSDIWKK